MSTTSVSTPTSTSSVRRAWRPGLTAAVVALGVNLAVLLVARLVGADMVVRRTLDDPPMEIGPGSVTAMTVVPLLIATGLLLLLRRRGPRAWRILAVVGLAIGLLTVPAPFTVLAEGGTRAALASMHVITGVVWFAVLWRSAARFGARTAEPARTP